MKRASLSNFLGNKNFQLTFVSVIAIGLAILLIVSLINYTNINLNSLLATVSSFPLWGIALFLVMTLLNLMIGAKKWELAVKHLSGNNSDQPGYLFFLMYTTLGAFIGLFVPIQVSTLAVRSISLRVGGFGSIKKGVATSLIAQFQDVIMITIFFIPGLFVIFGRGNSVFWLASVAGLIVAGFIFFGKFAFTIFNRITNLRVLELTARDAESKNLFRLAKRRIVTLLQEIADKRVLAPSLTIPLFGLSFLRFINLALRSYLISWLIRLNVSPIIIMSISSIVQLSLIIAVTPGNMGLLEWGWVGLLSLVGVSVLDAGQFALAARIFGYSSTIILFCGILLSFFLRSFGRRQRQGTQQQANTK